MKLLINKNRVFTFLFFTLFLDSYCIVQIGNRGITFWYFGAFLLVLVSLLNINNVARGIKENIYAFLMIIYMPLNYLAKGNGLESLAVGLICWIFYIFSYRNETVIQFNRTVDFFQKGMNIFAIYGIYQVFAYFLNLPFKNLWIDNLMVLGYNWGNYIDIGGLHLRRANAIFREPSFFSQFLAINILIYFSYLINNDGTEKKNKDYKKISMIVINTIALLLSFSGTGLLILFFGVILLFFLNKKKNTMKFIKKHILLILCIIIGIICVLLVPNPLSSYLVSRVTEFDSTNIYSVSGYLRMILPYQAAGKIIFSNDGLLGLGIGNAHLSVYRVLTNYIIGAEASIQPILPRTIIEEGVIGMVMLIAFSVKTWKIKNFITPSYKAILIGTYLMTFMHATWSSEVFWLFWGFLNVKLIDDRGGNNENRYRY